MIVISRQVGAQLSIGADPNRVIVTILRITADRITIGVENAASVDRGEVVFDRLKQPQAEPERPAE